MARSNSMADIDTYLADANTEKPPLVALDPNVPSDAVGAPVPEDIATPPKQTKEESKLETSLEKNERDAEKNERESIKLMQQAQLDAIKKQKDEESETIRLRNQAIQGAKDTASSAMRIVDSSKFAIGNIPIPGDIILPLSVLLIFFLALIPINGHTRLMWLWLTLTNNAAIQGGGTSNTTGGAGVTFGQPIPASGTNTATNAGGQLTPLSGTQIAPANGLPPLTPLIPFSGATNIFAGLSAIFTGVEDIL